MIRTKRLAQRDDIRKIITHSARSKNRPDSACGPFPASQATNVGVQKEGQMLLPALAMACFLLPASVRAEAVLQTIYEFVPSAGTGRYPSAWLAEAKDGSFYRTTMGDYTADCNYDYGTVFKVTSAGQLTTLFSFNGTSGGSPAGLTLGEDGCFYGVTGVGGTAIPCPIEGDGTVFKVTTNGVLNTLFAFGGTNGSHPIAGLTKGGSGTFYGLSRDGGLYGWGTIFRIATNGALTVLHSFDGTNGSTPLLSRLVRGPDDCFYGTTAYGGNNFSGSFSGQGTVFRITTNGLFTTLVYFGGTNGNTPYAGLALGTDQNFYGTTVAGGAFGSGTVFRMTRDGVLTNFFSFDGTNGARPSGGITQGRDGNYYGVTSYRIEGTDSTYGTVFKVTTNGNLTTLTYLDGTNGLNPFANLMLANDGNLYGVMVDEAKHSALDGNVASIFRLVDPPVLAVTWSNGAVKLAWTSFTNAVYRIEYKSSLASASWTTLSSNINPMTSTASFTDNPPAPERYYRLVLLP